MPATDSPPVRVRIAPSPTGDPHVGTGYIALFDLAFAQSQGGKFVLRIEDTDRARSTRESEEAIFEALHWLGLSWDEGPDVGGPYGPYRQSERSNIYKKYAEKLIAQGAAYRCFCTPERMAQLRASQKAKKASVLGYDGFCKTLSSEEVARKLAEGVPHVVRLDVPDDGETVVKDLVRGEVRFENAGIDDQVLMKSDGFPTYHLANVVDDRLMEITHVIRAEEWISSTPKHLLLYKAFGWAPPVFIHMPLLRNANKSKISKRKNPTSLLWYRERGFLPEAMLNFLALMGWSVADGREVFDLDEMVAEFSWDRVSKSAPVFDMQKLEWLNGLYIRKLSADDLLKRIRDAAPEAAALDEETMRRSLPLVQERMKTLCDYMDRTAFIFAESVDPAIADLVAKKSTPEEAQAILRAAGDGLSSAVAWTTPALDAACQALVEQLGVKTRTFFMTLRVAVTGTPVSPPLFESMELLGRDKTLGRIAAAADKLGRG